MKLTARTIASFLSKPEGVGALVYGPDEGLVRERVTLLIRALLGTAYDPLQCTEYTEDAIKADPTLVTDALNAMSLMGGRQIIIARGDGEALTKAISQVIEAPSPPINYLIVQSGDLPPRSGLRQLFESAAQMAALPCYADEAVDIRRLIQTSLQEAKVQIAPDALDYAVAHMGNDRQITRTEVTKMALYAGSNGQLALADIQQLIGYNRDISLDGIIMAAMNGEVAELDRLLQQAWREAMQPVAILRSLQRHLHRLSQAHSQLAGGKTVEQAVAALRPPVFFRQVPLMVRQVRAWPLKELHRLLAVAAETEALCKSGQSASLLCSQMLFSIASRARTLLKTAA